MMCDWVSLSREGRGRVRFWCRILVILKVSFLKINFCSFPFSMFLFLLLLLSA